MLGYILRHNYLLGQRISPVDILENMIHRCCIALEVRVILDIVMVIHDAVWIGLFVKSSSYVGRKIEEDWLTAYSAIGQRNEAGTDSTTESVSTKIAQDSVCNNIFWCQRFEEVETFIFSMCYLSLLYGPCVLG